MSDLPGIYAPSACWWVKCYPSKLIGPAKITLWELWSRALHHEQRGCEKAVVFVKPAPDEEGSPAEIFRRHIARETGQTDGQVVAHLTKLRALKLINTHGLAATLHWKPFVPAHAAPYNPDKRSGKPESDRENRVKPSGKPDRDDRENRVKPSGKPDHGSGKPDRLSGKPGAPVNSPSPPLNSPSPQRAETTDSRQFSLVAQGDRVDPGENTPAKISTWWDEVYQPARARVFDQWRPDAKIQPLACTAKRVAEIRARLTASCPGLPWPDLRERLTHVVAVAEAKVAEQRGEIVPYGRGKYDTIRNIAPEYWLKATNFDQLLSAHAPAPRAASSAATRGIEPWMRPRPEAPLSDLGPEDR